MLPDMVMICYGCRGSCNVILQWDANRLSDWAKYRRFNVGSVVLPSSKRNQKAYHYLNGERPQISEVQMDQGVLVHETHTK